MARQLSKLHLMLLICFYITDTASTPFFRPLSLTKRILNKVRTSGWMKNSWVKNANGKLKQTSFIQFASKVKKLKSL